jgi:FkbM family methyltransferase
MNLSAISKDTFFGKLLRTPLRLIPRSAVLPILQGPLRGKKWVAGSSTHGCWVGSFEYEKQQAFRRVVKPGHVVYDLGANVGFYSLLASVLVGDRGTVISFEPLPANLTLLRRHLQMNRIRNCTVLEAAASDTDGRARFDPSPQPDTAHLSEYGQVSVRTVRLDTLVDSREILPPNVMKIDIEGAELQALRGAAQTIEAHHPAILLATHDPTVHQACLQFLLDHRYRLESLTVDPVDSTAELLACREADQLSQEPDPRKEV